MTENHPSGGGDARPTSGTPAPGSHRPPAAGPSPGSRLPAGTGPGNGRPQPENASWSIFSYLVAGMGAYGGLGWLVGHWTGHPLLFPLGMLAGLALSIGLVIHRYGRP